MERINFEDGQLAVAGYVNIDGKKYNIVEPVYNGTVPLNAFYLNKLQDNIEADQDIQNNKITALETDTTTNKTNIEQLQTNVTSLETNMGNISNLLDTINGEVIENVNSEQT